MFKVDSILAEAGYSVLRLPPYHQDLNPIEMEFSCEPCKKVELDYLALEPEIDEISEQIIINLGENSDTEDDNDDSNPESDDEMGDVDL
ncbi:hypothetical protein J6590_051214, partial [Homalodisca vitripennis]